MSLQPQDVLVALRLSLRPPGTYAQMAGELSLSSSQVHASIKRCLESRLLLPGKRVTDKRALVEFVVHGLKYVYPPNRGPMTRGIPTAHSARPLSTRIKDAASPVVWPHPEGTVRGEALEPFHKSVPAAAMQDELLYELLVLVEGIRAGRARERNIATSMLEKRLAP